MRQWRMVLLALLCFPAFLGPDHAYAAAKARLPVKIYIIAGQSNAEPRGDIGFLKKNFPEYAKERPNLWRYRPGVEVPSMVLGDAYGAYGVDLAAGHAMTDAVDNDVFFMVSAVGGTTLAADWRPPSTVKRLGGEVGSLYTRMIKQAHDLIANLDELYPRYKGQGYELSGLIWFQGENDCCAKTQGYYRDSLQDLINDTRTDLGVPALPVVLCKINDACWGPPAIDIWAANEDVAHTMRNVVAINTRDLRPLCHYDSPSYLTIGQRVGAALVAFAKTPVVQDQDAIRRAAETFFARLAGPARQPNPESLREGLVEYWKFDENKAGNPASALEHGTAGRTWFGPKIGFPAVIKGKFGNALKLTGAQRIEFPGYKDPVNKDGLIEQMTLAFWARTTTNRKSEYRIGKGVGQKLEPYTGHNWYWSRKANKVGWDLRAFDAGGAAFTGVGPLNGKDEVYSAFTNTGFSGDGVEWRHVALVYDAAGKACRFYVNGALCDNRTSTVVRPRKKKGEEAAPSPTSVDVLPLRPAAEPLTIGGPGMTHSLEFQAYDEMCIWSRALTDEEVKDLYNGGAGVELVRGNPLSAKTNQELQRIVETNIDAEIRFAAVEALAARGKKALPQLQAALHDKTAYVRYRAAQAMGEMGREMTDTGLQLLASDDQELRVMGTVLFKHMARKGDPAIVVPALARALSDRHFDVRINAADALTAWGDWAPDAVPALIKAADDDEWWVRESVYVALSTINTPEARRALIPLMTKERHPALWFQVKSRIMKPCEDDPDLGETLTKAYGSWLQKPEGYINGFAARGKFGSGIEGLERIAKEGQIKSPEVAAIIRKILNGEVEPLWKLDDKARERLSTIQQEITGGAE